MIDRKRMRRDVDAYLRRGWCIIPIGPDKRPLCQWKQWQTTLPTMKQWERWLKHPKLCGLAVITGPVSGDLICRDFDDPAAYQQWAQRFPDLAAILPTVRTGRGWHVYFLSTFDRTVKLPGGDGEYRGAGVYTLLPPSIHPSGAVYRWTVARPDDELPVIDDPASAGLLGDGTEIAETEQAETAEQAEKAEQAEAISTGHCLQAIEQAIAATRPPGEGQRERKLFDLARHLKAIPALADADADDLVDILRQWHQRALPNITTKDFDETRLDFHRAWERAILPAGDGAMNVMLEWATAAGDPPEAEHFESPDVRRLAALCRELQRHARDGPFFLSCRTAGALLDVPWRTASRWLLMLTMDGLLKCEDKGTADTMKASRYFYTGQRRKPGASTTEKAARLSKRPSRPE